MIKTISVAAGVSAASPFQNALAGDKTLSQPSNGKQPKRVVFFLQNEVVRQFCKGKLHVWRKMSLCTWCSGVAEVSSVRACIGY